MESHRAPVHLQLKAPARVLPVREDGLDSFQPEVKRHTEAELRRELQRLRKRMTRFLANYAPPQAERRSRSQGRGSENPQTPEFILPHTRLASQLEDPFILKILLYSRSVAAALTHHQGRALAGVGEVLATAAVSGAMTKVVEVGIPPKISPAARTRPRADWRARVLVKYIHQEK